MLSACGANYVSHDSRSCSNCASLSFALPSRCLFCRHTAPCSVLRGHPFGFEIVRVDGSYRGRTNGVVCSVSRFGVALAFCFLSRMRTVVVFTKERGGKELDLTVQRTWHDASSFGGAGSPLHPHLFVSMSDMFPFVQARRLHHEVCCNHDRTSHGMSWHNVVDGTGSGWDGTGSCL